MSDNIMDIEQLKAKLLNNSLEPKKEVKNNDEKKVSKKSKKVEDKISKMLEEQIIENESSKNEEETENLEPKKIYLNLDIAKIVSENLKINLKITNNIINLLDEGNTVPFIARYRKELTGAMDDEKLREFESVLKSTRNLVERKEEILRTIDGLGKLTDEIILDTKNAKTLTEVENIYRPFKQKKKTRATEAKRKGLEGLSIEIKNGADIKRLESLAKDYLNEEVLTIEEAILGAKDIIAEEISDSSAIRNILTDYYFKTSEISSSKVKEKEGEELDPKKIYSVYYEYAEKISKIPSHRYLAINRGEKEEILKIKFIIDEEKVVDLILREELKDAKERKLRINEEIYIDIIKDSYKRLIKSSIEKEIRAALKENSDKEAISIFGKNLKQLLLVPPVKNMNILGYDPGFRNGSKLATIDATGKFLSEEIIHVTMPNDDVKKGMDKLSLMLLKDKIDIIAIGNGTASRESEKLVADLIKGTNVKYIIVSEAGASVYSASKLATEEFPNVNVSIRGAISIARRLQDPLSELVKIEPKSIGVGQYQHDVNQKELEESLANVVGDTVNKVGVDVNTATFSLISYVSGLSKRQAKAIVKYREEKGRFESRDELKKVSGIGETAFTQSAGFLRIYGGKNVFDMTGIHPENYKETEELLEYLGYKKEDILDKKIKEKITVKLKELLDNNKVKLIRLKEELENNKYGKLKEVSIITLEDIIKELINPGLDIREELPKPILRNDILSFEDLEEGMVLKGTVRNVAAFGAFVDIGIHDDGLVHISELSDKFIKDPQEVVKTGDIVTVKVISKNKETGKISLSMKGI